MKGMIIALMLALTAGVSASGAEADPQGHGSCS